MKMLKVSAGKTILSKCCCIVFLMQGNSDDLDFYT